MNASPTLQRVEAALEELASSPRSSQNAGSQRDVAGARRRRRAASGRAAPARRRAGRASATARSPRRRSPAAAAFCAPRCSSAYAAARLARSAATSSAAAIWRRCDDVDGLLGAHHAERGAAARRSRGRRRAPWSSSRCARRRSSCAASTVSFGTRASANACTSLAPWRITPAASCFVPGMKPGVSTTRDQRHAEQVAGAHEARGLLRRLGVEHAADVARLVGDDADRAAVDPGPGADDVARPALAVLEQPAVVDEPLERRRGRRRPCAGRRARRRRDRPAAAAAARAIGSASPAADGSRPSRSRAIRAASASSSATMWQTPLAAWTLAPPSAIASTSSPMTSRTTPGPVRNMLASRVMITTSPSAGE